MQRKRVKKENGFSLIEVIIAVGLLATGLLAVGSGEITAFTLNRRTSETMRAVAAAEDIIELMRRNPSPTDIAAYGGMNTNNNTVILPVTDAQIAFNAWQAQVQAISNSVAGAAMPAFNCGGVLVRNACGAVALIAGAANVTGVTTVIVIIVWPAQPTGITLSTTIVS